MADRPGPTHLQAHFESALQAYEKKTGITLAEHPLAVQIQSCDSVESITTTLLQGELQAFNIFQESDRIVKSVKMIVSNLTTLSVTASLGDALGLKIPPAKALLAALAILLVTAKDAISSCDALAKLLESVENFLNRLDIYMRFPRMPAMDEIAIKIMAELLSTLALATRELKQGRRIRFVKRGFGDKDVEAILQRLDRLTQDEARTTAAQSLEVVYGLVQNMSVVMDDGKALIDDVRKVLEMLHQMASDMNKSKREKLRRGIHCWLSPPDPWKNYNVALKSRQSETGSWFINGNTLSEWKASGPSSLLWIHGKPGAGKSVLCSTIIEEIETMRKSGLASLAMFYYDFREDEKKDLRGLLSSVLFQLCDQSNSYCDILSSFYSKHRDGTQSPSDDELVRCLKDLLGLPGQAPVYLIVDALDECSNPPAISSPREEVLTLLEDLISSQPPNLRICVTSRPEVDIKPVLEPLAFRSISLQEERGQKEDIENYIKSVVNTNKKMRRWTPDHKQLVIDILTKRADGMFRWVHCQLEYLSKCLPGRIQLALDELPETLDGTYERTLQEINDANWEFARRLLLCVAVVSRPLRVEELAEFLALDFKAGQIPKFREDWRLEDPLEAVLSTCSTLLSLVNAGNTQVIQFSHFSVKEFLISPRFADKRDTISRRYHVSMTPAHTLVAQACLGILLHLDESVTRDSLAKFHLAEYAAEHWFVHARFEGVSENADDGMKQLFDRRKPHFAVWLWICDPTVPGGSRHKQAERPLPPHGTALHYASFCGLHEVVEVLTIEHPEDVNSRSFNDDLTPLHLACEKGHVEIAQFLVEHGADAAAQNKTGLTPLHSASLPGHIDLARILIEHGADAAAQHENGWTPLHSASVHGHLDLARFLVEHGADAAAQNGRTTPLNLACEMGHVEIARFLVEHGAGAAVKGKDGKTPLHWASVKGHLDLARFLIEHGADTAAQDQFGFTPLHSASAAGRFDLVRLLIEHGADATAQDNGGSTPLNFVHSLDLAQFLVEHGADAAAQNRSGWTLLHEVSSRGHLDLARFLVENGADAALASQGSTWTTPLHQASLTNQLDLARFLVEHGADAAAQDRYGTTPLHTASSRGYRDFARFLVEHGADTTAQDKKGSTPLHGASSAGHLDLARFLVEHGADTAIQNARGWTPLHEASSRGQLDLARFLVEHGADTAAQDKDGSTPLDLASINNRVELAKFLAEHGTFATAHAVPQIQQPTP